MAPYIKTYMYEGLFSTLLPKIRLHRGCRRLCIMASSIRSKGESKACILSTSITWTQAFITSQVTHNASEKRKFVLEVIHNQNRTFEVILQSVAGLILRLSRARIYRLKAVTNSAKHLFSTRMGSLHRPYADLNQGLVDPLHLTTRKLTYNPPSPPIIH